MFAEILLAIVTAAVAVMVGVDIARTKTDDPSGQPDGSGYEVRPRAIGDTHGDRTGAYFREPFGTGMPATGHDVSLGRPAEHIDPSAADFQPSPNGAPMVQNSSTVRDRVSIAGRSSDAVVRVSDDQAGSRDDARGKQDGRATGRRRDHQARCRGSARAARSADPGGRRGHGGRQGP